jgi:hypothetical protein
MHTAPDRVTRNYGFDLLCLTLWGLGVWLSLELGVVGWWVSPIVSAAVGWLWYRYSRPARVPLRAGEAPCPRCRSLQTDREVLLLPDGTEGLRMRCFACDHHWPMS